MHLPAAPYIPQAFPFVLVTALLEATPERTVTSFVIPPDHVLVEAGCLSESGLVENMAQSAAAGRGYLERESNAPGPGYIGALKNLQIEVLPPTGATIRTEVISSYQILNASVVQATVFWEEKIIASSELKIFIQE